MKFAIFYGIAIKAATQCLRRHALGTCSLHSNRGARAQSGAAMPNDFILR